MWVFFFDSFELVFCLTIKSVRPFFDMFFAFRSLNTLIKTDLNSTRISVPNQGEQQGETSELFSFEEPLAATL